MHVRSLRVTLDGRGGLLLVPAAALAVHQLRYSLAYGSRAGAELAAQGHSYLHSLVPWIVLSLCVAASGFLRRVVAAAQTGALTPRRARRWPALWGLTTGGLVGIYAVQETLEGLFAPLHPNGAAGVVGHGGWWAVPAAAVVALVVVALLRGGHAVLRLAAASAPLRPRVHTPRAAFRTTPDLLAPAPLALAAAGRAPPAA